ncbi:MAG: tRNA (adenosine(37)-N6)-dimethylallyltransferase MiaA [Flavobacteriales bacterium]|jgi:tRNA dimethylallyltransferase
MKKVVAISGPTGVGKTALAISLANHFQTDIISCDSRQFYKEMSIGVARPSMEELNAARHHFISFLSVEEEYTAGMFSRDARAKIQELFQTNEVVIVVGGSMLYMDALLYGLDELPGDKEIRNALNQRCEEEGLFVLVEELKAKDPDFASSVDLENAHRVIRALEVIQITGKPFSELRTKSNDAIDAKIIHVFLSGEREWFYDRINRRVDKMVEEGLFEEVQGLQSMQHLQSLNTVGYKEIFKYIEGSCSKEEAVAEVKKNTRNYAKRQMTWYRNKPHVRQFDVQKGDVSAEIISLVEC